MPDKPDEATHWMYVISRDTVYSGEDIYEIREIYFGPDGKMSWTEDPVYPMGNSVPDMIKTLELMDQVRGRNILDMTLDPPALVSAANLAEGKG